MSISLTPVNDVINFIKCIAAGDGYFYDCSSGRIADIIERSLTPYAKPLAEIPEKITHLMRLDRLLGVEASATFTGCIVVPVWEEVTDRLFIQEILLRQIPKAILGSINPSYSWLVDTLPIACARIIASTTLFTFSHINYLQSPIALKSTFILGAICGLPTEVTHNIAISTLLHVLWNTHGAQSRGELFF